MNRNATSDTTSPRMVAMRKGAVVNDVMPSMARLSKRRKLNDDCPATRSPCSKRISCFLKPIQQYMPFV